MMWEVREQSDETEGIIEVSVVDDINVSLLQRQMAMLVGDPGDTQAS